jgi:cellulose synthase operon protein C
VPLEQAQSPLLLQVRAQIQMAQGRIKDASDSLRQILLNHPNDEGTRQRLIQFLVDIKQPEDALRLAREGLSLAPGNSTMMELVVGLVRETQGLDAALAEAATMQRDPLNLPAARLLKGSLYMAARRYDDAIAAYKEELRHEPFTSLVLATAAALNRGGHEPEGLKLLRDWVAKQPDAAVSDALSAVDIAEHRLDLAEKNLEAVLTERPNDAVALNNLAWIYQQANNPKARELARRAYLLQPSPQSADTLGWILVKGGETHVGLLLVRRAAASLPHDPTIIYHLAVALKANGQSAEAAKLVTALLSSPAKFDERDAAMKLQTDLQAQLGSAMPVATPAAAPDPAPAQQQP